MEISFDEPEVIVIKTSYLWMINYNYLIIEPNSRKAVIVDPSWELQKIKETIYKNRAELSGVIITHAHPDHIHLAEVVAAEYGCKIWMSDEEIYNSGLNNEQLVSISEERIKIGSIDVKPILTPGHSSGGVCYLIGDDLFTGDTLFAEGCGICTNIDEAEELFKSLDKLKKIISSNVRIYPGHSYGKIPGQKFGQILKDNIYLQFNKKEDFIKYRLRKGQNKNSILNFM